MKPGSESSTSLPLRLLLDPNQYERPTLLVSRLSEAFAEIPRSEGVALVERFLFDDHSSLHRQYVVLDLVSQLAWPEFQDTLRRFIHSDAPIKLLQLGIKAISTPPSLRAYRICRDLVERCKRAELVALAQQQLTALTKANSLVHLYHALIEGMTLHRDPFWGLSRLAAELERGDIERLLPSIKSAYGPVLASLARLAALQGDRAYVGPLLKRLQSDWLALGAELRGELLRALVQCAKALAHPEPIWTSLKPLVLGTVEVEQARVLAALLPLMNRNEQGVVLSRYNNFSPDDKRVLLAAVGDSEDERILSILLRELDSEEDETLLSQYVEILMKRGMGRDCLERVDRMRGPRQRLLLIGICSHDCRTMAADLLAHFHEGQDDEVLVSLSSTLLEDPTVAVAQRAWRLMSSGVSERVLSILVRRLILWFPLLNLPYDHLFDRCLEQTSLRNEWLVTLAKLLEAESDSVRRMRLLEGVMFLFEHLAEAELVHYLLFFKSIHFHSEAELTLIRHEVQMLLNSLLKVSNRTADSQLLAEWLRELDKHHPEGGARDL